MVQKSELERNGKQYDRCNNVTTVTFLHSDSRRAAFRPVTSFISRKSSNIKHIPAHHAFLTLIIYAQLAVKSRFLFSQLTPQISVSDCWHYHIKWSSRAGRYQNTQSKYSKVQKEGWHHRLRGRGWTNGVGSCDELWKLLKQLWKCLDDVKSFSWTT